MIIAAVEDVECRNVFKRAIETLSNCKIKMADTCKLGRFEEPGTINRSIKTILNKT